MKAYLTRRYQFPASHRLHCPEVSDERNQSVYGKCNHPYGHGHNYSVEITVSGRVDPRTGMVVNLADLDAFVQGRILERFDHANLNVLPEFATVVPTTENLCAEIFRTVEGFTGAAVEKVRIQETRKNSFEYGNVRP
jgi:6-pyruvoyltetrahydropterin/6-carboxytetrahydropterin synthase